MLYGKRLSRRYKTLQEILSDLIIYINSLDLRLKDKESLLRIYREKRRFQERLAKQKLQERRSAELSEQRRLEELEKIAQDEKKKFEEFMQKKDQEINKLLEAIQTQHKLYDPAIKGSEIYRREKEIERLRFQIEEAIVRETIEHDIMHPHGKIVRNDPANMIAFIDIGKTKRVQPGMIFLIGKRGKKWKLTYKAKIVVKKVMKNFSQVRILKLYDPTIPVVEGDKIYNPFFSPKRPLVVVFAGKDDPELRYTLEEAKGRIIELGSIVREEVDLQTDFVVVASGADEDPNYIKAQQLSIPLVKAKEIFKFLGE
jgi:NAD-dependent DNA ligase